MVGLRTFLCSPQKLRQLFGTVILKWIPVFVAERPPPPPLDSLALFLYEALVDSVPNLALIFVVVVCLFFLRASARAPSSNISKRLLNCVTPCTLRLRKLHTVCINGGNRRVFTRARVGVYDVRPSPRWPHSASWIFIYDTTGGRFGTETVRRYRCRKHSKPTRVFLSALS